jgi:hypothetical protein
VDRFKNDLGEEGCGEEESGELRTGGGKEEDKVKGERDVALETCTEGATENEMDEEEIGVIEEGAL